VFACKWTVGHLLNFHTMQTQHCEGQQNICCHCGEAGEKDKELLKKFKVVLPICAVCHRLGKETMKRNPIK